MRLPRLHHHDLADCAAIDQLLGPHERGGEDFSLQIPVAHAARADGLEHRARLGGGPPEGLGAEQAAPGLGEAEADVLVAKRRQAHHVEVDAVELDQVVQTIGRPRDVPLFGKGLGALLGPRVDGDDPLVRDVRESLHVEVGDEAGTEQRQGYLVRCA